MTNNEAEEPLKGWNPWRSYTREFEDSRVHVSMVTQANGTLTIDAHDNDELLIAIELAVMEATTKFASEVEAS